MSRATVNHIRRMVAGLRKQADGIDLALEHVIKIEGIQDVPVSQPEIVNQTIKYAQIGLGAAS